ncbi:hypothetical protein IQ07DRAFT_404956 [Pyrenochaeta sp. DS3sAY3a]|nr:hypothetical protein IQ07DRAFT_404956 [Pyrenochaeta sp. DS3sAY3a]
MFQFINVGHPDEIKQKRNQRSIKQHAIRRGIEKSKPERDRRKDVFVPVKFDDANELAHRTKAILSPRFMRAPSMALMDPFDTLCASPERLRVLMNHPSARQAGEPIFCVEGTGKLYFQGLEAVFKGALIDPVLFNALSLMLALAAHNNFPNVEILVYRGKLLDSLTTATKDEGLRPRLSTITAMLMLIGYEYRVDGSDCEGIAVHIRAVQVMLQRYGDPHEPIIEQLHRALFWQDLLSCLLLESRRVISHEDYSEYRALKLMDGTEEVPTGFFSVIHIFQEDFVAILQDIQLLCTLVDESRRPFEELPMDSSQANLESRMVDLLSKAKHSSNLNIVYRTCIFAAYLCTYNLSTGIWMGYFVPEVCVDQIYRSVTEATHDQFAPKVLLWVLSVAGGLTQRNVVKKRYIERIRTIGRHLDGLYQDLDTFMGVMKEFIWCERTMGEKMSSFWRELHNPLPAS